MLCLRGFYERDMRDSSWKKWAGHVNYSTFPTTKRKALGLKKALIKLPNLKFYLFSGRF